MDAKRSLILLESDKTDQEGFLRPTLKQPVSPFTDIIIMITACRWKGSGESPFCLRRPPWSTNIKERTFSLT